MHAADVKSQQDPTLLSTSKPEATKKGCSFVLSLFLKPPWIYCTKHLVLFVPHDNFAFLFLAVGNYQNPYS